MKGQGNGMLGGMEKVGVEGVADQPCRLAGTATGASRWGWRPPHLACGGARTDPGLLRAHNGQPPQLLELSEILPPGQAVDFLSLTIGGNDIRFSEIVEQLVGEPDAPLSLLGGERLHDRAQRLVLELREGLARVAACLGEGFQGRPCAVEGPSGRDDDFRLVTLPPIPIAAPERVVHVTYPDLTTRFVRDDQGALVPDEEGHPQIEICPSGAVEDPGDLVDGMPDGLRPRRARSPYISRSEWAWADATLLQPADPAPNDSSSATYVYSEEAPGGADVPLSLLNTLNSIVMESEARFGWSSSSRWWLDSRGRGYCAPEEDSWVYRSIFHPNEAGYVGKAEGLIAEAERLGLMGATP